MAKVEEVERIKSLIKQLKEVYELGSWLTHTAKMIEKVKHLNEEREMLEVVIGEKIIHDEMKRVFLRGNKDTTEAGGGMKYLFKYLERESR